jgi:hypothetical protein
MYLPSRYQKPPKKCKNKDVSVDKCISRKNNTIRTTLSLPIQGVLPREENGLKNLYLFSNSMTKKGTFPKLLKVKYTMLKAHEIY